MIAEDTNVADIGVRWLAAFDAALSEATPAELRDLFTADCYGRDVLALTWNLETHHTQTAADRIWRQNRTAAITGLALDSAAPPPERVMRISRKCIEVFFRFETSVGSGRGIVRLVPDETDEQTWRAWTLLTSLEELSGHAETVGDKRPIGQSYSRDFQGPNWLDKRIVSKAYADRDPAVLVVGGGQAGLSIAARLTQLGVDTLIVDRHARVGDNFTVLAMSMMAGFGLSPVVAETLIGFGAGLDQVFYLYGGTLLLAGVIFMGLKAPVARHALIESEPLSRISIGAINRVLASRAWVSVVLGLLSGSVFAGMNNFQTVISSSRALNYADYFLTYTLTVIILRVFLIRYSGGQNPYRTLGVLLMLLASSPLLLLFSGSSQMLYVVVAMLFGLGYGTSYPIISAMAANDALEDLTAQTLLVFSFAHFIGVFGFPLVAGWIIVEMGIPILLGLVVALAAIEAGLAFARSYKPK